MGKIIKFGLLTVVIVVITIFTALNAANKTHSNSSGKIKAPSKDSDENKRQPETNTKLDLNDITFDFPNADLKVFVRFVAKLSGKTLIGEDLLKGNITIKTQKKMNLQQVIEVFEHVLNSRGLEYIETKVYMEIIPLSDSIMKVYEIKYLKAADIAKSLTQMFRMSFRLGKKPENIQITSIAEANTVMVLAPKSQQMEIEKAIKKLDVPSKQVLLEIMIVELTKESEYGFGITYNYSQNGSTVSTTADLTQFTTKNIDSAGGFNIVDGVFKVNVQGVDKKTKVKLLSQPRIIAKENEKANIKIGEKQNYISGSSSLGPSQGITQTTSSNDIGLDIEITPRINKMKSVILELKFQVSSVLTNYSFMSGGSATDIPVVGQRIINNTSSVGSGETLVIGGLLKNNKTVARSAPPVLGDMPLVGWLLAKESELVEQIELMVFITPTVIENSKENRIAVKEETDKLRDFDPKEEAAIDQMLTGKKVKTDNVFNLFDYFRDEKYRKEQHFIPQPENL
jgi:type II secretory pathway component GspD/PulD (secretin)